jgi:ribonucleoside-diphosphate reductase alpha chain
MGVFERAAYLASAGLAAEKGAFPLCDREALLASPNITRQPAELREAIARDGLRNGCLTSIAPTGSISLLAGNVSSGIEPIFDLRYRRRMREGQGWREDWLEDYALAVFRALHGADAPLPPSLVTAAGLTPDEHLEMQAAVQAHIDSSISKTINCPESLSFEAFGTIYQRAYDLGLKGCTTFRPNPVTGAILTAGGADATATAAQPVTAAPVAASAPRSEPVPDTEPRPAFPVAAAPTPAAEATRSGGAPQRRGSGVVYMAPPLEREAVLAGYTYKLKWAGSDHALYITLNDIEQDGRRRPFEIFINTRNLEHYAWTVALTRMISAVFRRGGDVSFVVDELKAVFDPQGGQWMDGRYVPSLLAAIGEIIERHMRRTGFLPPREAPQTAPKPLLTATMNDGVRDDQGTMAARPSAVPPSGARATAGPAAPPAPPVHAGGRRCPRCGTGALVREGGCWVCADCGYSRCE